MAKDIFHDIAKKSLENDGWEITHDPFLEEVLVILNIKLIVFDPITEQVLKWIK